MIDIPCLLICLIFLICILQTRVIVQTPDGRQVPTSELVRRSEDIGRLAQDHPARSLALRCITDDPSARPSAAEFYHELRRIQQSFVGVDKVRSITIK